MIKKIIRYLKLRKHLFKQCVEKYCDLQFATLDDYDERSADFEMYRNTYNFLFHNTFDKEFKKYCKKRQKKFDKMCKRYSIEDICDRYQN